MASGDASKKTAAANKSFRTESKLDWEDQTDLEGSRRGFIARMDEPTIACDRGGEAWDLRDYTFLQAEEAPSSVNPSLWRQARLNMEGGLFKVADHVYQVRGHDLSVISFIEGERGWIVIDPLISAECVMRLGSPPAKKGKPS